MKPRRIKDSALSLSKLTNLYNVLKSRRGFKVPAGFSQAYTLRHKKQCVKPRRIKDSALSLSKLTNLYNVLKSRRGFKVPAGFSQAYTLRHKKQCVKPRRIKDSALSSSKLTNLFNVLVKNVLPHLVHKTMRYYVRSLHYPLPRSIYLLPDYHGCNLIFEIKICHRK